MIHASAYSIVHDPEDYSDGASLAGAVVLRIDSLDWTTRRDSEYVRSLRARRGRS